MKYLSTEEIRGLGLLQEVNREFFHPLGFAAQVDSEDGTILIQDWREDPEGVIFAEDVMSKDNYEKFNSFRNERHSLRQATLGFIVQEPSR